MFTGIVRDIGRVAAREQRDEGRRLALETSLDLSDLEIGESIAVDGACLTVVEQEGPNQFAVDVSPETVSRTTLGSVEVGDGVHLERALRVGDRLGGHFVQGHVDGVGTVDSIRTDDESWILTVDGPDEIARWLIPKGSIAVDGVSLTINGVDGANFWVTIVPHTAEETKLAEYTAGSRVNIEADMLGKYAARTVPEESNSSHQEEPRE